MIHSQVFVRFMLPLLQIVHLFIGLCFLRFRNDPISDNDPTNTSRYILQVFPEKRQISSECLRSECFPCHFSSVGNLKEPHHGAAQLINEAH